MKYLPGQYIRSVAGWYGKITSADTDVVYISWYIKGQWCLPGSINASYVNDGSLEILDVDEMQFKLMAM